VYVPLIWTKRLLRCILYSA